MGSNSSVPANYTAPGTGLEISFLVLATVAIVGRGTARYMQNVRFWFDDALAYLAYATIATLIILQLLNNSMGDFDEERFLNFTPHQQQLYEQRVFAQTFIYPIIMASAKLSVLFLIRRVFWVGQSRFMAMWWLNLLVIFPCWTFTNIGVAIANRVENINGYAGKQVVWVTSASAIVSVLSDVMILILPIRGVLKLQLAWREKIGIIGIFCIGLLTTSLSITRAALSFEQALGRVNWNIAYLTYVYDILAHAELTAAVLCACTPVLRPVFAKIGEVASQSMNTTPLRRLVSKTSLSLRTRTSHDAESASRYSDTNQKICRTVDVHMDSFPFDKAQMPRWGEPPC